MLARDQFESSSAAFEGDRTMVVRSLPQGAQVTRAVVTLEPVAPPSHPLFEESITFPNGQQGDWGTTKVKQSSAAATDPPGFVEVDFHARRTLASVTGSGLLNSTLQVDLGGLYVQVTTVGAIQTPTDPSKYTLAADTGGLLPSLVTNKFKLSLPAAGSPDISEMVVRSTPSNIILRLGQQPPFFARPGELAQAESCPDFSQILQNFLADAQVKDGFYEIPLTVHSDTIARLNVTMELEYVQEQNALPGSLQQATLTFDHSSAAQSGSATLQVSLPAGAQVIPGRTTARVRGSFQNSQIVYGPTGGLQPAAMISVNPSRAQAAPLVFSSNLAASAVDLLLTAKSRTAEFSLDLVEDADGKPWTQSVLPEPAKLGIDSEIAGKPTWINVPLPIEVQLKANVRYWLVLQSLRGEAVWSVSPQSAIAAAASSGVWTAGAGVGADAVSGAPVGVQYTDNGGLSWRQEAVPEAPGPLEAFVHLRQPPAGFQVPIALQVGEGASARRVSLDRFQPLGRVDFSLDFDEVAQAINQAAGASGPPTVPQGEHLRNGDMEKWKRVGDRLNSPQPQPVENTPVALAVSSDGGRLYVLSKSGSTAVNSFLGVYETACGERVQIVSLGVGTPVALALSPDGTRAAVTIGINLVWVDLDALETVGSLKPPTSPPPNLAFSPDGSLLYLPDYSSSKGALSVLSVSVVEQTYRSQADLSNARLSSVPIGDNLEPVDIVVSPDGARLYVGVVNHAVTFPMAELYAFDAASGRRVYGPVPLQSTGLEISADDVHLSLALSLDGRRIAAANGAEGTLSVVDARRGRLEGAPVTFKQGAESILQAVAISPDGRRAFVADLANNLVNVVDLPNRLVTDQIDVRDEPHDLAITPEGEKLYVGDFISGNVGAMSVIPIGALVPEEWTLTSGDIFPLCVLQPFHRIAILGDFVTGQERQARPLNPTAISEVPPVVEQVPARPLNPTAISEVVPVVGGVHYVLAFTGLATTPEAEAEVFWYGGQCNFQQVDRLPFETIDADPQRFKSDLRNAARLGPVQGQGGGPPAPSRLEMTSPQRAILAEVRFSVPANEAAVLDNASLQATGDALSNSDLQGQSGGRLSGWELIPTGAVGVTVVAASDLVTIRNGGNAPCSLQQAAPFQAGKAFSLVFAGQGSPGQGSQGDPLVRLEWLGANGESVGTPLEIPVAAGGSDRQERRGASPSGAQQALLSLELPPGASLAVRSISLDMVEVASVPISFVAQAPGELTVSDVRVAYEMVPPPPPKVPPQGLCPPTPPGAQPGSGSHGHCHCPNCGEDDDLCGPEPSTTPGGAPALEGECCHCGARITLPGGPPRARVVASRPVGVVALAREPQEMVAGPVRAEAVRAPLVIRRAVEAVQPRVRRASPAGTLAAPSPAPPATPPAQPAIPLTPKLTDVAGLTEEHAARLAAAGINSVAKLSRAKPEAVTAALGVAPEAVAAVIKEAKRLQRLASKKK